MNEVVDVFQSIEHRKIELKNRRKKLQSIYYALTGLTIALLVSAPFYFAYFYKKNNLISAIIPLSYGLMFLGMLLFYKARLRDIEAELQELELESDLLRYEVSNIESRAEKLLRINQTQLRRYYELTLSQNIWIFIVGILCILLGIILIGITLYLIINKITTENEKIIVAITGIIGSLFTNFVAAIYLKMHASASKNLSSFHERLVETHQLLLGNLIASRIENNKIRWETLSKLALKIAESDKSNKPFQRTGDTAGC